MQGSETSVLLPQAVTWVKFTTPSVAASRGKAGLGWNELVGLLAALGIYASAQAIYYLATAESSASTLTALSKLFGHTNVETLN